MKRSYMLLLWAVIPLYTMGQQSKNISGKVVSKADGLPLPGATVVLKESGKGTTTDENGEFTLSVSNDDTRLTVSSIGFYSQNVLLKNIAGIPIILRLEERLTSLDKVIVSTGYETLPQERATGSFITIDNDLLNRGVSTNILDRLEDIASGIAFDRRGDAVNIDIRGRSTIFANADPLIVLDNFPYEGDINNINPNDIESITVLRDAAAASIWGVRAGNGVIVITTKKGGYHPPRIEVNANVTIGNKPDFSYLPWMSPAEFVEAEKFLFEQGFYDADEQAIDHPPLSPVVELLIAERDGKVSSVEARKQIESLKHNDLRDDFEDYLYRASVNQQYSVNLSGGNNKQRYFLSAGYDKNLENEINNKYERLTLRANNTLYPVKNLEFRAGVLYTQSKRYQNNPGYSGVSSGGSKAIYPYAKLADEKGNPIRVIRDYRFSFIEAAAADGLLDWEYRPLEEIALRDRTNSLSDLRITAGAKYTILSSLDLEVKYQYQRAQEQMQDLQNEQTYFARDLINRYTQIEDDGTVSRAIPLGGILNESYDLTNSHSVRGQFNYDYHRGKNQLSAIAGMEIREGEARGSSSRLYGYDEDILTYESRIDYASFYTMFHNHRRARIPFSGGTSEIYDAAISYYTNAAYSYDERYTVSASARLDQSNLFGVTTNQKGVPLWSAGVSWRIDNEDFYNLKFLPDLKFRLTYGYNGNLDKTVTAFTTARYSSNDPLTGLPYVNIVNPPNPELRWEKVRILNVGIDFAGQERRISGSIEYYHKKGSDLLGFAPVDPTTGITSFKGNVANMVGEGVDLILNTRNVKGDFNWNTNLLFSFTTDKVTKYLQSQPNATELLLQDRSIDRVSGLINPIEGNPVFGIYSYRYAGLDPATGDPLGYGDNGEVSKDWSVLTRVDPEDLVYHGSARPTFFGSFRNTFSWKGLSISANIAYKLGYYFKGSTISYTALFNNWNGHKDFNRRWKEPGDENSTQIPSMVYPANPSRDRFLTNSEVTVGRGDHIRLQDVNISYRVTKQALEALPLSQLKVYIYANNLGVIWKTNDMGIDPDFPRLLAPLTIALGLNIEF